MVFFFIPNFTKTLFFLPWLINKVVIMVFFFFNVSGDYENIIMGSLKRPEKLLDLP